MKRDEKALLLKVVGALVASEVLRGTVDGRIVGSAAVQSALAALGRVARAQVFRAISDAKREIAKETQERVELVKG